MKAYLSYSLDDDLRHKASSGGFCKEFIRYSIEYNIFDKAIITVLGEGKGALVPNTIITNDIEKVLSTKSNSIYDKTNPLSALKKLNSDESYIFVGLPCHILPFKKYCVKRGIRLLTISLFCNHTSKTFSECILNRAGINKDDVIHFEYRGSGWPGYVRIITKTGEINLNFHDCWNDYYENHLSMLTKCKKCIKLISYDADICVGDAWLQWVMSKDTVGTNIVLSLNFNVEKLLEGCSKRGYIHLEQMDNSEFEMLHRAAIGIKIDRRDNWKGV